MKRCILIDKRIGKDKDGNNVLFIRAAKLPTKMKDGKLWHPKKDEFLIDTAVSEKFRPVDYKDLSAESVLPGCLLDVTYGLNEATAKTYISKIDVVPNTCLYSESLLFLE